MFKSTLSRSASLQLRNRAPWDNFLNFFYRFSLKNRGVWRSAISVIADWPIFLSLKYRNTPFKKQCFIFESLDVAFRYARNSGLTHQKVKIQAQQFRRFFIRILADFFKLNSNTQNPPPLPTCTLYRPTCFADLSPRYIH